MKEAAPNREVVLGSNRESDLPTEGLVRTVLGSSFARSLERSWTDFLDANPDNLTSPEDLPDHALITCEQMLELVGNAVLAEREADGENR